MDAITSGKTAAVLTVGNEIVTGKIVDSNAHYISHFLTGHGYRVAERVSVGDYPGEIAEALSRLVDRYDIVVVTGGLGPTHDDVTTQSVCDLFGLKRTHSEAVLAQVTAFYRKRGRAVPEASLGYAMVPEETVPLSNRAGIAPGLFVKEKVLLLPGVPSEMKAIIEDHAKKLLPHGGTHVAERLLHTAGIGEAQLLQSVAGLDKILELAELASLPENGKVDLRLTARGKTKGEAVKILRKAEKLLVKGVEEHLYGFDDDTIATVVGGLLANGKKTLAVAESCTGGGIGAEITSVAGSSVYFLGGVISYDNRVKVRELGVPKSIIDKHGAVSEETALSMARGARRKLGSSYGLSVTGVAGPGGGTKGKPVGLVYIGFSGPKGEMVTRLQLGGSRSAIRQRSTFEALFFLYRVLSGRKKPVGERDGGWHVYLAECRDKSLYCGITNDIEKRLNAHNSGKGALYTKWKGPVKLAAKSPEMSRREAMSLERRIKKLKGRETKLAAVRKG